MRAQEDTSTLLGIVDTQDDDVRIEVVATHGPEGQAEVELRWQTQTSTLGWITQRRMELSPAEARDLGAILRRGAGTSTTPTHEPHEPQPRVVDLAAFRSRAG